MERALDEKYEALRKLEEELGLVPSQEELHAYDQSACAEGA